MGKQKDVKTFVDVEDDRRNFIKKLISVYEIIHPSDDYKLSQGEKNFLAECILLDISGVDMGSKAARKHLEDFFGLKRRSVYTMRRDLKNKKWLRQDDYGYHYPIGLDRTEFKLNLKFNGVEHENNGQDN